MKFLTLTLPLLAAAISLSISAPPANPKQPQQKALSNPQPASLSPSNSFSTSSDLESNSDSSSKSSKSKFPKFSSLLLKPAPSSFKCHRYSTTTMLTELSTYITALLRSYRESISSTSNSDQERLSFETCYAGYEAWDAHPSVYFGNLAKKQSEKVETLLRNMVLARFPSVEVVRDGGVIAIVVREGNWLRRRNTV